MIPTRSYLVFFCFGALLLCGMAGLALLRRRFFER